MKALVYHGPGQKAWEVVPDPEIIYPTDVIVQVDDLLEEPDHRRQAST